MNHKSNYETGVEVLWNIGDEISPLLLRKQIKIFCTILVAESPQKTETKQFSQLPYLGHKYPKSV